MLHVEGILRQMGGASYRCDRFGNPIPGHEFGDETSLAKFHSGQKEPVDANMVTAHRGPYTFGLKDRGQVTYVKCGEAIWVREGRYNDFEASGFKLNALATT